VLSYTNLVEQERLYKESGKKNISDLEFYSGFSNEEFVQCINLLQPQYLDSQCNLLGTVNINKELELAQSIYLV